MLHALLAGFGLSMSLIVAPGAQNVFVLKMGIRREHVALLAVVCIISDILLISAGVLGFGAAVTSMPWVLTAARLAGAAFLAGYGMLAAKRAVFPPRRPALVVDPAASTPREAVPTGGTTLMTRRVLPAVLACLAFTWLNPHTYLDTVFLVGSVSTGYGAERWIFAAGAMAASTIWFIFLAALSRLAARWFASALAWRVLDGVIALVMLTLAVLLLIG